MQSRGYVTIVCNLQITQITHAHYTEYTRRLANSSTKEWKKVMVKRDDLRVSTWGINWLADPWMWWTKDSTVSSLDHALPFCLIELTTCLAWSTCMICNHILSSRNKYNSTAVNIMQMPKNYSVSLGTKCLRYTALLTLPNHNMPRMEEDTGCLPSCKHHSHDSRSLTVRCFSIKAFNCACKSRKLEIAPMW